MEIKELYEKISDQAFNLRRALANTAAFVPHIERMKNVLYNNLDEIEMALKFAADAEKKIKILEVEIESADAELKEKDDEIAALKTKSSGKKTSGKRLEGDVE